MVEFVEEFVFGFFVFVELVGFFFLRQRFFVFGWKFFGLIIGCDDWWFFCSVLLCYVVCFKQYRKGYNRNEKFKIIFLNYMIMLFVKCILVFGIGS